MTRKSAVLTICALLLVGFAGAAYLYQSLSPVEQPATPASQDSDSLVRFHSPVLGPTRAPVTIVEFFDPSCEACRAFYPFVKQILTEHPDDVRLVIRYTLFHQASEETARLLEAARLQNLYQPVMEAILIAQPQWHDDPKAIAAWDAAERAGLDVEKARSDMHLPAIDAMLAMDMKDVKRIGVSGTPTFFVNGQPLREFGPEPLRRQVNAEVLRLRN